LRNKEVENRRCRILFPKHTTREICGKQRVENTSEN